ncbi:hypothetical protein [Nitrosospira sp. Nsp13]|uniref:hypothetical protein n=1 Tax=Nitrosospira sp. Nsp13 TaxID=1855332 RepID=UPI00088D785A|nr:hypothetical protein [Nitrosospira sp. Nsp13]SCX77819.1 hypothetical protein SAMN05216308_101147 [Nitrosospira sp. Nsp13]
MTSWWTRFRELTNDGKCDSPQFRVVARDNGIAIEGRLSDGGDGSIVLPWTAVSQVVAYKRDVYAGDLICLGIELDGQRVVELDETMQGWQEFIEALPVYLAGAMSPEEIFVRLVAEDNPSNNVTVFLREELETQKVVSEISDSHG